MEYTPRFQLWKKSIIWNYRIRWYSYRNEHTGKYQECEENWFVSCGLSDKWFKCRMRWYYDGHKMVSITLFHLEFCKGYSWAVEEIK